MSHIVVFQGDSITDCDRDRVYHSHLGTGYPLLTAATLSEREPGKYQFHNRGISGNRVVDLYARIRKDMIQLKPDYMSILIGINGVWHEYADGNGVSAEKFELVYGLLIEELQRDVPGLRIMILEPFVLQRIQRNTLTAGSISSVRMICDGPPQSGLLKSTALFLFLCRSFLIRRMPCIPVVGSLRVSTPALPGMS